MNVSKISLNKLLDEILSKKISILGDSHLDENWVYNQRIIVSKLLNKNVLFGLECPTELLAFSPLTDLIPANRRVPLVNSSETEEKEYNRDITKSLITYASFFDNSIVAILGDSHLDLQHKQIKIPNIIIHQSFNGAYSH